MTQLLSKHPDMFLPGEWPTYYSKCKGVRIEDCDGKKYLDMTSSGIGSCVLGYADSDVNRAVVKQVREGNMCTLNSPLELELADLLVEIHPWADMVRYARTGGEAMSVAVRIVRAASGREKILFCGYHGWHDWYVSSNLASKRNLDDQLLPGIPSKGVPQGLKGTTVPFRYNDLEQFKKSVDKYSGRVAAVVMEPVRHHWSEKGFLETIRRITREKGIILVFDEITSGWRICEGGIHRVLGVDPDIAVFGKGLSNGYPLGAVIGRKDVMKAAENTFISSTYWTEATGFAAAIATIKKYRRLKANETLVKIGGLVQNAWSQLAQEYGISCAAVGIEPLLGLGFQYENEDENLLRMTYTTKRMLEQGILSGRAFYPSAAHRPSHVKQYESALRRVFQEMNRAGNDLDKLRKKLKYGVIRKPFSRLN